MSLISFDDFQKLDIRVGKILSAELHPKAKKPAYILQIDFGLEIGIKTSSAQLVENYSVNNLIGLQILAVVNFPEKNIGGIVSQVLVLATIDSSNGTILLRTDKDVVLGSKVF